MKKGKQFLTIIRCGTFKLDLFNRSSLPLFSLLVVSSKTKTRIIHQLVMDLTLQGCCATIMYDIISKAQPRIVYTVTLLSTVFFSFIFFYLFIFFPGDAFHSVLLFCYSIHMALVSMSRFILLQLTHSFLYVFERVTQ